MRVGRATRGERLAIIEIAGVLGPSQDEMTAVPIGDFDRGMVVAAFDADDRVVGYAHLSLDLPGSVTILHAGVLPTLQQRGYMRAMFDWLLANHGPVVRAWVDDSRYPLSMTDGRARMIDQRNGFQLWELDERVD